MKRALAEAVAVAGILWAGCDGGGTGGRTPEERIAPANSPSSSIAYTYTALASHPAGGLTATNVKDGIDQAAAVGYGALDAAAAALVSAKNYSDAGDAATLASANTYADGAAAAALTLAQAYADAGDSATFMAAKQYADQQVAAAAAPCPPTCQNSMETVYQRDGEGTCVLHFRVPCQPYACDDAGVACNNACISNADCSTGAQCDTIGGSCTTGLATCADVFTVLTADQSIVSCLPYECLNGHCQQQCVNDTNCIDGYHCTSGRCVED